jgi:hypothetical protein
MAARRAVRDAKKVADRDVEAAAHVAVDVYADWYAGLCRSDQGGL